ncbi:hypothetical protein A4X09_0g7704, partial [Tilletia walkeri]
GPWMSSNASNRTSQAQDTSDNSSGFGSLFRDTSPGAPSLSGASTIPGPSTTFRGAGFKPAGASTSAAQSLSSRFNKLSSIAMGSKPLGRSASASTLVSAQTSGSAVAGSKVQPIPFKNGITLIKDRRLIGQTFHSKNLKPIFDSIVEHHRMRVRPLIDKKANARSVYNTIIEAFVEQGHDFIQDGWKGFEYAYTTSTDHRLMTLGPEGKPKQSLSAAELASEYHRRECYIVVQSDQKCSDYDPMFFEMADPISDDEFSQDGMSTVNGSGFQKCFFCQTEFTVDLINDHESTCGWDDGPKPHVKVKSERVKSEKIPDIDSDGPEEDAGNSTLTSVRSSGNKKAKVDNADVTCACGKPDDDEKTMVGCDGTDCDVWRHRSCADESGFNGVDWFCPSCRPDFKDAPAYGSHHRKRKQNPDANVTKRVSPRNKAQSSNSASNTAT